MKLIIEIPDEKLQHEIDVRLKAVIAEVTATKIDQQITEILEKQLGRFDEIAAGAAIQRSIDAVIEKGLGKHDYDRRQRMNSLLSDAAMRLIRERSK